MAGAPVDAVARRRFGYMPEERGLYPKMRVLEQLVYFARLHGLPKADADARARETVETLGVAERAKDRVETLSLGNQQRVQLAAALVHRPDVLVLDEPFSGLDPVGVDALAATLRSEADRGVPVLFSSHQLELVERLCDAVVLIDRGRIVAQGSIAELRASRRRRLYRVEVAHGRRVVGRLPGVHLEGHAPEGGVILGSTTTSTSSGSSTSRGSAGDVSHFSAVAADAGRALPRGGAGVNRRDTDRGSWFLVMQREFWVRLRDKGFLVSTLDHGVGALGVHRGERRRRELHALLRPGAHGERVARWSPPSRRWRATRGSGCPSRWSPTTPPRDGRC